MTDMIAVILVCNLGLLACLVYYRLLWANERAFQVRRALLIILPIIVMIFPNLSIEVSNSSMEPLTGAFLPPFTNVSSDSQLLSFAWFDLILLVYLIGMSIKIWQWSRQWFTLNAIVKNRTQFTKLSDHKVVILNADTPTFSFWDTIFIGRSFKVKEEADLIYQHELVHVQQKHSLDILFYDFLSIIFWFNPAIYALKKEVKLVHELLADANVCKQADPVFYTDLLINQTLYHMNNQWMNHFAQHDVLKRVKMLKANKKKPSMRVMLSIVPFVLVLFLALACETAPMTEASTETTTQIDKIYEEPEVMPSFNGGMDGLIAYLSNEIKYPESAKTSGISGKVLVRFVVAQDGTVTKAEVLKGFDESCDAEALRVVENMPKWNAGTVDGQKVAVSMVLPIQFKI